MSFNGWIRIGLAILVCFAILVWDQRDSRFELPFMGASCIAVTLVFGGWGLAWYIRYRARGRE